MLEADAAALRERLASGGGLSRSRRRSTRIEGVRRALAPITDPALLAESLAREAGLARALRSRSSPLRAGYAARYLELEQGEHGRSGPWVGVESHPGLAG